MHSAVEPGWLAAFKALKENHALTDDAIGIFAMSLRFNLSDIQTIASEAVTGGGDDKKCDVIFVDRENAIAVLAQCYLSKRKKEAAPANKALDLNAAINWLLVADLNTLPKALKGRADELRSAIASGEVKQFYIWYVHNLPGSVNVERELRTVEDGARSALARYPGAQDINIFAEEIHEQKLEQLYTQAERTIIVTDEFEINVDDAIELKEKDWNAVVTTVRGSWLRDLYNTKQTALFSANLRHYLGFRESDANINFGIKKTAEEEPANFYVYNNGITALVLSYSLSERTRQGRTLRFKGLSIVNGAQTTGSIANLAADPSTDLQVPVRFVKANREEITASIVRFNNLQNKLQAADFRSKDSIQDRLRGEFNKIPDAEYEGGRRGGASATIKRSKYLLASYTVGQSLAAFHGEPVTAYDKKSELWTSEANYRRIFTDRTSARHIVFCYSLLAEINNRRLDLLSRAKTSGKELTSSECTSLDFLNGKGANYLLVHVISQCMETILGRPISNRFDIRFRENLSPAAAEKLWAPIIDMMLALSGQLEGAFSRNRISNESVQKGVPPFIGIVVSLKTIHRATFEAFASHVEVANRG
jgi:hypothetical protein